MNDADKISEILSLNISKLMDAYKVNPLPPKFWVELRYMMRGELASLTPASSVPDGWQLVPKEPTLEMVNAGLNKMNYLGYQHPENGIVMASLHIYKAMLCAASTSDGQKP